MASVATISNTADDLGGESGGAGVDCDQSAGADDCSGHDAAIHGDGHLHRRHRARLDNGCDLEFVVGDGGDHQQHGGQHDGHGILVQAKP